MASSTEFIEFVCSQIANAGVVRSKKMFGESMPGWRETADIKWNFTKFLIDSEGNVVARFEPTATAETMLPVIQKYLNNK